MSPQHSVRLLNRDSGGRRSLRPPYPTKQPTKRALTCPINESSKWQTETETQPSRRQPRHWWVGTPQRDNPHQELTTMPPSKVLSQRARPHTHRTHDLQRSRPREGFHVAPGNKPIFLMPRLGGLGPTRLWPTGNLQMDFARIPTLVDKPTLPY
ncbi:Hypothetical predicted protein [Pelobates cultripes]|uniref:Uncharacterized protein n=1 Tax=Pelobates cultripes TaxID=61616 RepID=A0AAD1VTX3_PELCU|nr:Hypothetical predicted protein [Pelobates cultripes]